MNEWKIRKSMKFPSFKNPVMIEGLPGIGNVGKVAADFLIEELDAKKLCSFESNCLPHSVFVREDNLVELPGIYLYYKKLAERDVLFLAGDSQPVSESSTYTFSESVLDLLKQLKGRDVVTLGGIGLNSIPKKPKVYCTGTSKKIVEAYSKGSDVDLKIYGTVGPIIGVSGLLLGIALRKKMNGISFLAETYGHPMYLGIRGARQIVRVLSKKFSMSVDIKELDREIKILESEEDKKTGVLDLKKSRRGMKAEPDSSYIG